MDVRHAPRPLRWHVNFLGVGLHNYGLTSGKGTIWILYSVIMVLLFGGIFAALLEKAAKPVVKKPKPNHGKGLT